MIGQPQLFQQSGSRERCLIRLFNGRGNDGPLVSCEPGAETGHLSHGKIRHNHFRERTRQGAIETKSPQGGDGLGVEDAEENGFDSAESRDGQTVTVGIGTPQVNYIGFELAHLPQERPHTPPIGLPILASEENATAVLPQKFFLIGTAREQANTGIKRAGGKLR